MDVGIWKRFRRGRGMAVLSLLCVFALIFTVACGGDDDDDDDTASGDGTVVTTVTTGPSGDASPTATEEEDEATEAVAAPTEEDEEAASPTATEDDVEPTATKASASPTATEAAADDEGTATTTGDTGDEDDALADVNPIDPEALPNFSMSFTFDVTGVPNQDDTSMAVEIEQSSTENYYMFVSAADMNIEVWLVDGTTYMNQGDGTIIPLPEGTDPGLVSPAIFLQEVPPIDENLQAERVGEEEVSGRNTIHYTISGENYLDQSDVLTGGTATDIEGQVDVWIDTELNIMIKQIGDVSWTNEDSTSGTFLSDLLILDIGATNAVEAPV
jgi:hypothetical protein